MLTTNQKITIILIIIFLVIIYFSFKINDLEKKIIEDFVDTTDTQINNAVKKIYLADVEAIRLLSNFAIQLSQGGTTIPGKVNFTGRIGVVGRDGNDLPANWNGGLRTQDIYADGTIGVGPDKNTMNVSLHNNGVMRAGRGLGLGGDNTGIFLGRKSDDSTIDGATKDGNNVEIRSWWGIGFKDTAYNKTNIWFDLRTGTINCKGINIVDDSDANNPLCKIDSSGNIVFRKEPHKSIGMFWRYKNDSNNNSGIHDDNDLKIFTDDNIRIMSDLYIDKSKYLNIGDYWKIYEDNPLHKLHFITRSKVNGADFIKDYNFDGNRWHWEICNREENLDYINNITNIGSCS